MTTENLKRIERSTRVGMGPQYLAPIAKKLGMTLVEAEREFVVEGVPVREESGTGPTRISFELSRDEYEVLANYALGLGISPAAAARVLMLESLLAKVGQVQQMIGLDPTTATDERVRGSSRTGGLDTRAPVVEPPPHPELPPERTETSGEGQPPRSKSSRRRAG